MADVTVDYTTLEHSEQSLQRIAAELAGADARREQVIDDIDALARSIRIVPLARKRDPQPCWVLH